MLNIVLVKQEEQTRNELINSLVALEKSLFHRNIAWDADDFLEALEEDNTKLIVLIDSRNAIHGYCLYQQYKKRIDISSVGVSSSQRGHNYGFFMLEYALNSASSRSNFLITIDCMPSLMGYYAKMGFEEYGVRDSGYYELSDDDVDGVHMKVSKARFDEVAALAHSVARVSLEDEASEDNTTRPSAF